jgi:hypothetical protein
MSDKNIEKAIKVYEKEVWKDQIEIETEKEKFANAIKSGLGEKINDYRTYIKPEPSFLQKLKTKINKIFKYI